MIARRQQFLRRQSPKCPTSRSIVRTVTAHGGTYRGAIHWFSDNARQGLLHDEWLRCECKLINDRRHCRRVNRPDTFLTYRDAVWRDVRTAMA
jgi:hypothetical protein